MEKTVKLLGSNPQPLYSEQKEEKSAEVKPEISKEEIKPEEIPAKEVKPTPLSTPKPAQIKREEQKSEKDDHQPVSQPATSKPAAQPIRREPVDMDAIMRDAKPLKSWPEVVDNLKQYSRVIASSFEGTVAYASGDYLLIDAKTDIPFKLLQKSDQRENLRNAVQEITGKRYILGPYKKTEKKEEEKDPLEELIAELKDSNIEIVEN